MPHYRRVGDVPKKRHVAHHLADGRRASEELMGQAGFAASSSLLYHRFSPSAVVAVEPVDGDGIGRGGPATPDRPLLPRHLRTGQLAAGGDLVTGRTTLLANDDVSVAWAVADRTSPLHRDACGDELVYVQSGRAVLESVFGSLAVGPGDYVVVPRATTHRWVLDGEALAALVLSTSGHVGPPARYLTPTGQLLERAPYCERDIRAPDGPLVVDDAGEEPVLVRNRAGLSRHVHAHHPFDVVGWDGCVYPWAFNIADFEPVVGSLHQPPPVHQTFEAPGVVVCSFVPRPFDFHPDAIKVPYHHANTDSDEVLFYSAGDFMSRAGSGIGVGSISFHPAGFVHGPQPGSVEASMGNDRTEELAVMVDTFRPFAVTDAARAISDDAYPFTWAR